MSLRSFVRKLILKEKSCSEEFVAYYRKLGAHIGERTIVFEPTKTFIDVTRPWMISIGNDVQITRGVTILTHGYDWSVLKGLYGDVLGSCGEVVIGNNVFIGMNATILKGVHIGDNCIIGANSLVNKDVESGWVVAGNPAKPIIRIEDYHKKRLDAQLFEAEELYRCYVLRMNQIPPKKAFSEFFWLFEKKTEKLEDFEEKQMRNVGNYEKSLELFLEKEPMFNGYNDFLEYMSEKYPLVK